MRQQIITLLAAVAVVTTDRTNQESFQHGGSSPNFQHSSQLSPSFPQDFGPNHGPRSPTFQPQHHRNRSPKIPKPATHHTAKLIHENSFSPLLPPTSVHPVSSNQPPYGPGFLKKPLHPTEKHFESGSQGLQSHFGSDSHLLTDSFGSESHRLTDSFGSGSQQLTDPVGSESQRPPIHLGSKPHRPPIHLGSKPHHPPIHLGSKPHRPQIHFGSKPHRPPIHLGSKPHRPQIHSGSKPYHPPKPGHTQHHYGPSPKKHPPPHTSAYHEAPACAYNTSKSWCLEDQDYPMYEVQGAVQKNRENFITLYADVADLNTANSVDGLHELKDETYLCASDTSYVRPLRAVNVDGDWRVIVNGVKLDYEDITQTVRIEECLDSGEPCPLVPKCYASTCAQKFIYHRFLIYNPHDVYFPFAIESFKLPASCSCFLDSFYVE